MKPYLFFLYTLITVTILLSGCTIANSDNNEPVANGIAPTAHPLFSAEDGSQLTESNGDETVAVPTVSSIFEDIELSTQPLTRATRPSTEAPLTSTSTLIPEVRFTIFNESLNNNWSLEKSYGMEYDPNSQIAAYQGRRSLELRPTEGYGKFSFTVKEGSEEVFLRDEVLALSFWVYSEEDFIDNQDLLVRVKGSNEYAYWVDDDNSVELTDPSRPLFPSTRLIYLGIQDTVPVGTWVNVEVWLDDLLFEPEYEYITGITIINDEDYDRTFYIDNVQLILKDVATFAVANPDSEGGVEIENNSVLAISINTNEEVRPISPLIYGLSGGDREDGYLEDTQPTLLSWGGNPSTRYNWEIGNAWNAGSDWFYSNVDYQWEDGVSASDVWAQTVLENNLEGRMVVPTLGWVAKDTESCSFPLGDGTCGNAEESSCERARVIAIPETANTVSDVDFVLEWLRYLRDEQGFTPRFLALDNEPELWGYTHYDVHPTCTTYKEVLDKYITYATALRNEFPEAELGGPVVCCWFSYWGDAAPGPTASSRSTEEEYLPWFLDNIRQYDEETGLKILDVLDVHYYPQGLQNDIVDEETSAWRLRSTRSLWDADYVSESWIDEAISFIPRMKQLVADYYPGIKLGISEWNFGADEYMNGALVIADVLGIYGREDVYMAAYWRNPSLNSPGYNAFKMYTNYDDNGSKFGDTSVFAESSDYDAVSSYASIDSESGNLHIILINKLPNNELEVQLNIEGYLPIQAASMYRYDEVNPDQIIGSDIELPTDMLFSLPPYSITQIILQPQSTE